jgi:hypothetical protein
MGGYFVPYVKGNSDTYLLFNNPVFEMSREELFETLQGFPKPFPFLYKGRLYWSEDIFEKKGRGSQLDGPSLFF